MKTNENSVEVIGAIKDNLHLNITPSDINVALGLGDKRTSNISRPIIIKVHNRHTVMMNACITVRPMLHINVSLTLKRRILFKII